MNRPLSGTLMDPLIHLIAAESSTAARLCEPLRACPWPAGAWAGQEGDTADVRYLKNGAAKAIRTLRTDRPDAAPTDRVIGLSPLQIQRRFTAAARAAGIEARLTAHSGRVGLASELTAHGASTTEVMLAGNWRTSRMVAHYSAGATAERGAVAKYL